MLEPEREEGGAKAPPAPSFSFLASCCTGNNTAKGTWWYKQMMCIVVGQKFGGQTLFHCSGSSRKTKEVTYQELGYIKHGGLVQEHVHSGAIPKTVHLVERERKQEGWQCIATTD